MSAAAQGAPFVCIEGHVLGYCSDANAPPGTIHTLPGVHTCPSMGRHESVTHIHPGQVVTYPKEGTPLGNLFVEAVVAGVKQVIQLFKNESLDGRGPEAIHSCQSATSPFSFYKGSYEFRVQDDGNLVVYKEAKHAEWSSNSHVGSGRGPFRLMVASTGELLHYDRDNVLIWRSGITGAGTYGSAGDVNYRMRIQDDGNLVVYYLKSGHEKGAIWASRHAPTYAGPAGRVMIEAVHSGKVLDVPNLSMTPVGIQQYSRNGGDNQRVDLIQRDNNYYIFRLCHSRQALDVDNESASNNAAVSQYHEHGGHNQQFRLVPRGDDCYSIHPRHAPNMALDIRDGSCNDNAKLQIYTYTGSANQLFRVRV